MDCPRCARRAGPGVTECPCCGVVFARWKDRVREPRVLPPDDGYSVSYSERIPVAKILAWTIVAIAAVGTFKLLGRLPIWYGASGKSPPTVATAQPRSEPARESTGFDPALGLERLEGVVRQIRAEAGPHGVEVTAGDLRHWFEKGAADLHFAVTRHQGGQAGLTRPETRRFDEADRRHRREDGGAMRTKCLQEGRWRYAERMPSTDNGVSECWWRLHGQRTHDTGSMVIHYGNGPVDFWERWVWQPRNRRWAPYSENDELRIMEYMIDAEYGIQAQQRDRERSRKALEQALSNTTIAEQYRRSHIKQAVLTAYESKAKREGLLYRIEYLRSR